MTRSAPRSLMLALLLAGSAPCFAASPLAHLLACRRIRQPAVRLACFDRESASLAAAHAHRRDHRLAHAPSLSPQRTFGLSQGAITAREIAAGVQPKPLSRISSRIARISRAGDGRLVFTLSNGQAWVELEQNGNLLARPGETARVSRQLFGSYWMELQSGRGCKVERVR